MTFRTLIILLLLLPCAGVELLAQKTAHRRQPPSWKPHRPARHRGAAYKKLGYPNLLTIYAPQVLVINDMIGIGGGLEYERFIDKSGMFSFVIPFTMGSGGSRFLSEVHVGNTYDNGTAWFVAPGFAFHPLGNGRRADFSIGLQYAIGSLDLKKSIVTNFGAKNVIYEASPVLSAVLFRVGVDIHTASPFVIGFQAGCGPLIGGEYDQGALFQFGLKLGARF